jgi:hypothetical protein
MEPMRHREEADFAAVFFRRTTVQVRNPGGLWDESFATLAQAVVITGLINLAAGYEFGAAKPPRPPEPLIQAPPSPTQPSIPNERPEP